MLSEPSDYNCVGCPRHYLDFKSADFVTVGMCICPAMDWLLIRDVFSLLAQCSQDMHCIPCNPDIPSIFS